MNVLISGANEGIGYYLMKQLLKDNNSVYVLDINVDQLEKLSNHHDNLYFSICDISKYDDVSTSVSSFNINFDIVIHNACKCIFDSFENTPIQIYKDVLDVNYFGALNITKSVINKMNINSKIMYVSSGVAVMGFSNISAYANSKNAIESFARCMNLEYKSKNISFHIIHPPLTATKSSSPLPIPNDFMENPQVVGTKLANKLHKNSFIICHSALLRVQTFLIYLFPTLFGSLFNKLTSNYHNQDK